MGNEKIKDFFLVKKVKDKNGKDVDDININTKEMKDKKEMFDRFCWLVQELLGEKNV